MKLLYGTLSFIFAFASIATFPPFKTLLNYRLCLLQILFSHSTYLLKSMLLFVYLFICHSLYLSAAATYKPVLVQFCFAAKTLLLFSKKFSMKKAVFISQRIVWMGGQVLPDPVKISSAAEWTSQPAGGKFYYLWA